MAERETGTVKVRFLHLPTILVAYLMRRQKWNEKGFGFIQRDGMGDR